MLFVKTDHESAILVLKPKYYFVEELPKISLKNEKFKNKYKHNLSKWILKFFVQFLKPTYYLTRLIKMNQ